MCYIGGWVRGQTIVNCRQLSIAPSTGFNFIEMWSSWLLLIIIIIATITLSDSSRDLIRLWHSAGRKTLLPDPPPRHPFRPRDNQTNERECDAQLRHLDTISCNYLTLSLSLCFCFHLVVVLRFDRKHPPDQPSGNYIVDEMKLRARGDRNWPSWTFPSRRGFADDPIFHSLLVFLGVVGRLFGVLEEDGWMVLCISLSFSLYAIPMIWSIA